MTTNIDDKIRWIYEQWHRTVRNRDLMGTLALYAEDAILETPLAIAILSDKKDGVLKGKAEIKSFFEIGSRKLTGDLARWYRTGTFFSNGKQLTWEYPRETPQGDQIDLIEMMDIKNGLIVHHRVYWGWFGFKLLSAVANKLNK